MQLSEERQREIAEYILTDISMGLGFDEVYDEVVELLDDPNDYAEDVTAVMDLIYTAKVTVEWDAKTADD